MAQQQESCNPLWPLHERSAVLWCVPHPLRGPLCHLLVSISQGLRGKSKAFMWIIQGCFRRWRQRRNTGRLVLVHFLIVRQAMKATRLGCFDHTRMKETALLRAHQGIIVNTALCGYLAAAWNHQKAAHRHQQKYKPTPVAYSICSEALCKIQWKQHPAWGWFLEINPFSLIRVIISTLNTWLHF